MKKIPNTYVIISVLIILCALATWLIPAGQYITSDDGTLNYTSVERNPQGLSIFTAFYQGFVKQAGIIVFILIVGGTFWLLNSTGAINAGITRFISVVGKHDNLVLAAVAVLFSLAGAIFGMSEETIPFVGIMVPLVVSMGYDAFTGMLVVYVAANIGFSSAFLNPFTVGIAQQMSGLPLFSGMGYRIICWALLTGATVVFTLVHARKVKDSGRIAGISDGHDAAPLDKRQILILCTLGAAIVMLVIGVTCLHWYIGEISGLFLAMGTVCGIIAGFSANRIADEMINGARDILGAALVVGLASGAIFILQEGHVIDSILHSMQEGLAGTSREASLGAMYGIQAVINFLLPSATAKAAITIPIMAPFADMVGVSRQAMVLAFQFGDGFTNMITPTSGVLIASLAMAKIPYTEWFRWSWKWISVLILLGFMLLLPTVILNVF